MEKGFYLRATGFWDCSRISSGQRSATFPGETQFWDGWFHNIITQNGDRHLAFTGRIWQTQKEGDMEFYSRFERGYTYKIECRIYFTPEGKPLSISGVKIIAKSETI